MSNQKLDCVIVGYNDISARQMNEVHPTANDVSGAARTVLHNTIELSGKRMNYMSLLNTALAATLHQNPGLHVMKMPNLAICYLKSFLSRRGLDVEYINFFDAEKERLAQVLQQGVRVAAITTTFYVEPDPIIEIVQFIRQQAPETLIIVGGPHIFNVCNDYDEVTQNYLLRQIGADIYIHDGQGEDTLAKLLFELRKPETRELGTIPNLIYNAKLNQSPSSNVNQRAFRTAGRKVLTSFVRTRRELENNSMDENVIDWNGFPTDFFSPTVQLRTARSCAFKCAFCSYLVMAGPLVLTGIEVLEQEMRVLQQHGVKNLVFIDDTFNVPLPRFKELLKMMIRNKFDFNWFSYFRCSNSDDEAFNLMAESGCKGVFLGIESGDQDILVKMNKAATVHRYEDGIRKLNERGIISFASFIVGFPGETRQSVQNSIDFVERSGPTFYRAQLYYHRTNLPIDKKADEYGLKGGAYNWQHNSMRWDEACDLIDHMYFTVKNSIILPEATFDFWSIPYLIGMGISMDQIIEFARVSQKLLLCGLRKGRAPVECVDENARLQELIASCSRMHPTS
jgi:p-methyltransferase